MATKLTYDLTYDAPLTDVGEMLHGRRRSASRSATRRARSAGPSASAPTAAA